MAVEEFIDEKLTKAFRLIGSTAEGERNNAFDRIVALLAKEGLDLNDVWLFVIRNKESPTTRLLRMVEQSSQMEEITYGLFESILEEIPEKFRNKARNLWHDAQDLARTASRVYPQGHPS